MASCPDAVIIEDWQGHVLETNETACRMFGYEQEEWEHVAVLDLVLRSEKQALTDRIVSPSPNGRFERDMEMVRRDGSTFFAHMRSWRTLVTGRECTFVFIHDISERQRARAGDREAHAFLESMLRAIPAPVYYKDVQGRYLGCNAAFEALTGYTIEELHGRTLQEMWPQQFNERYDEKDRELLKKPGSQVYEIRFKDARGRVRDLVFYRCTFTRTDGAIGGIIGTIHDITEQKNVERALRESEERFRRIFESSHDCIVVIGRDMTHLYVNAPAAEFTGKPRDAIVGHTIEEVFDIRPGFAAQWAARVRKVLEEKKEVRFEDELPGEDGPSYSESVMSPIMGEEGKAIAVAIVYRDLTEQRRAEKEHAAAAARQRQNEKTRSLGTMAGAVAHHFNNLMMAILGNLDMLREETDEKSIAGKLVSQVLTSTRRAAELSSEMLLYVGQSRQERVIIDLNELVQHSIEPIDESKPDNLQIHYRPGSDMRPLEADREQIRTVLSNVLTNAVEAIGYEPGQINISTGAGLCDHETFRNVHLGSELPEGHYVWFQVEDNGHGMDEETRSRVFDPFFTTKFTGRGLGLASALGIVRAHDGGILMMSRPGAGTIVRVYLPACCAEAGKPSAVPMESGTWKGSGTVLLVEDETTVAHLCQGMLEQTGFTVLHAANGRGGVDMFHSHRDEIVCVLLDLVMPDMDGEEVCAAIRETDPTMPVVISSGLPSEEVARRFARTEINGILHKPYHRSDLATTLRLALTPQGNQAHIRA